VRHALREHAEGDGILRTVRGRGYRIGVPVEAMLDEAPAAEPPVDPLDRPTSQVFVGRKAELARLRAGLADALSGRSRILMLVGEPGIGKTRTAEEFAKDARRAGAQVLWGRCYEGKGAPAFWPWHQSLRVYVQACDPETLRSELGLAAVDLAAFVPEVRQRLPDLPEPPALEPHEARLRLFEGVVDFLRKASARRPLAIVLDDLHGADEASLSLLEFLAAELRSAHLLVLGTYRDVELRREHRLAATLAELARREQSERIQLGGLARADVAQIIAQTSRRPVRWPRRCTARPRGTPSSCTRWCVCSHRTGGWSERSRWLRGTSRSHRGCVRS
jgi:predicted ATPase